MKKFLILFLTTGLFTAAFSQSYKKQNTLGISFFLNDFNTAAAIKEQGLAYQVTNGKLFPIKDMNVGAAINYLSGLSDHADFIATLGASFLKYPIKGREPFIDNKLMLEATAGINLKLMTDRYWLSPFIDLGVGASKYANHYSAFIPAGVGLQVSFARDAFLLLNSQYRIPVTQNATEHLYHSIGVVANVSKREEPALKTVEVPVIADRDGDGVIDSLDACPDEKGLTALGGCPDQDGDGIADKDDKCVDVAGIAKYQGCPIPDTDRDGINDEEDKCPNVPGVARYQGCPVPDTDEDGVNDEDDKCPNEAGPASNYGCPVIDVKIVEKVNKAADNVFFATGSARLLAKSHKSLDGVADIMKQNPSYRIAIGGHTDNTGGDELNQKLSESRANAVKEYLLGKGVPEDRISATGYGEAKPVADNGTAAGRAKNRRVEIQLSNY